MLLKPLFRLPQKMNLHFVRWFKLCFGLSIVALVGTVVLLFTQGLNFGIDFKGGTLMQIQTPGPADAAKIRTTLYEPRHRGDPASELRQGGRASDPLPRAGGRPRSAESRRG